MYRFIYLLLVVFMFGSQTPGFSKIKENPYEPTFKYSGTTSLYKSMDIYHPTKENFQAIENFIRARSDYYKVFRDYQRNAQNVRFYGANQDETPKRSILVMNTSSDNLDRCIVSYASYNKNYPRGQKRLEEKLRELNFEGHLFSQTGGWPNLEEGSLTMAHLIYAFKPAMIQEAKRMGYKKILWLDTSIVPLVDLDKVFKIIEEKGVFIFGGFHPIGPYTTEQCCKSFGIDFEETFNLATFGASVVGLDLTSPIGEQVLDEWHKAAKSEVRWCTSRPDQSCLSIILHMLGFKDHIDKSLRAQPSTIKPDSLFLIDRAYVNQLSGIKD